MGKPREYNPYDYPVVAGQCSRCRKPQTFVIGSVCLDCLTDKEKEVYGIDQDLNTEED